MKKKLIGLSLLSALMLSSCNKELDNTKVTNNENLISFSTYSNLSKGIVSTNVNFPSEGSRFRVAAFLEGTEKYMDCEIVANAGKQWNYANASDQAYWPSVPLNFVAFTPITAGTISLGETSTMTYNAPSIIEEQVDLMYSYEAKVSKPNASAAVQINFKHALTQIRFKATTTSSNLFVDIAKNGIEMCNIVNSGTLNVSATSSTWTLGTEKASYKTANAECTGISNATFTDITDTEQVLMLIPQVVTPWDVTSNNSATSNTNSYLKINCKIYSKATSGEAVKNVYLHGTKDSYDYIYIPFSGDHMNLIGKRITYGLQFGGGYTDGGAPILSPITFSSDVSGWVIE